MAAAVILDYGLAIGGALTEPVTTGDQLAMGDSLIAQLHTNAFAVGDSVALSDGIVTLISTPAFAVLDTMTVTDRLDALLLAGSGVISAQFNQAMQLGDSAKSGYGSLIGDSLTIQDAPMAVIGAQGIVVFESVTTWLDSASPIQGVKITTVSLPATSVGQPYSVQLTAVGGILPYTWSVISGSLPDGLTLSSDGVISGTLTTEGESDFTVQVLDSSGMMGLMRVRV